VTSLRVLPDDAGAQAARDVSELIVEAGPAAPPWPHEPVVEWQVLGHCNYDCSYCIQSKKHRVGVPSREQLDASLAFLASLPGRWEVKTTGGEPFAFKGFLDVVVPGLLATPHRLSTLTNLSAPQAVLRRFAALTRGRLHVVSASLHLEHTAPEPFLDKLEALRDAADPSTRIVVNCVLAPDALDAVQRAQQRVLARGFKFFPQLMKVRGGVVAYAPAQMERVRAIVGDLALAAATRSANLAPAYTGRRCFTGARYLVLTKDGEAWSCRTAKRHGEGFLGDVRTGVTLRGGPARCSYTICPCATPANRGMIEGVPMKNAVVEDDA
jgi:MoaA/NifB/PqqE/SkfB family radical SAM enzyme